VEATTISHFRVKVALNFVFLSKYFFRAFWPIQLDSLYLINEIPGSRDLGLNTTQHGE
jgi:hypothetical protein